MAVTFLSRDVSDLLIGKPPLRPLPPSAAAADALAALRRCPGQSLAVLDRRGEAVVVAARLSLADVVCYLCSEGCLGSPGEALARPAAALVSCDSMLVRPVEANSSILEALDVILEGAQTLVVPLRSGGRRKPSGELCWLTQEDFIRYFLNSIALFSHVATQSIDALGLVRPAADLAVHHYDSALSALPLIRRAIAEQTAVAVVGDDGKLYGEISPLALSSAGEAMAAAIAALSVGDLMAYIDYYDFPPEGLVRAIKAGLKERGLDGMVGLVDEDFASSYTASSSSSSSSSSDEDSEHKGRSRKLRRSLSKSLAVGRRSEEPPVCHPGSSLVAVMAQALAQRISYLWVVDEADCTLLGIVTFVDVLRVLREHL